MKNLLFVAKCTLLQKETERNKNGLKTVNKNQDGSPTIGNANIAQMLPASIKKQTEP